MSISSCISSPSTTSPPPLTTTISTSKSHYVIGEPILIQFQITNQTAAPLKILRWGTPLETKFLRNNFKVLRAGQPVPYIGRLAKRNQPQATDFITILPQQMQQTQIDLTTGYQLDQPGKYTITYNSNLFQQLVNTGETHVITSTLSNTITITMHFLEENI